MEKEVCVDWNGEEKRYTLSQAVPVPQAQGNRELKRLLAGMKQFKNNHPPRIFITEVLHPADRRGHSGMLDEAKAREVAGLAERGVHEIVCRKDIPDDANVLGGRFVLAIKNAHSKEQTYKARFVVQGHTDVEKYPDTQQHQPSPELSTRSHRNSRHFWLPTVDPRRLASISAECGETHGRSLC